MAKYSVELRRSAEKELERLPVVVLKRMITKLEKLADNPRPNGSVKLKGGDSDYRVRVGEYRAVYFVDDEKKAVSVMRIRHRKDVYE